MKNFSKLSLLITASFLSTPGWAMEKDYDFCEDVVTTCSKKKISTQMSVSPADLLGLNPKNISSDVWLKLLQPHIEKCQKRPPFHERDGLDLLKLKTEIAREFAFDVLMEKGASVLSDEEALLDLGRDIVIDCATIRTYKDFPGVARPLLEKLFAGGEKFQKLDTVEFIKKNVLKNQNKTNTVAALIKAVGTFEGCEDLPWKEKICQIGKNILSSILDGDQLTNEGLATKERIKGYFLRNLDKVKKTEGFSDLLESLSVSEERFKEHILDFSPLKIDEEKAFTSYLGKPRDQKNGSVNLKNCDELTLHLPQYQITGMNQFIHDLEKRQGMMLEGLNKSPKITIIRTTENKLRWLDCEVLTKLDKTYPGIQDITLDRTPAKNWGEILSRVAKGSRQVTKLTITHSPTAPTNDQLPYFLGTTRLTELSLSDIALSDPVLKKCAFSLRGLPLVTLDLSGNKLNSSPAELFQVTELSDEEPFQVTELSEEPLKQLVTLNLSRNPIDQGGASALAKKLRPATQFLFFKKKIPHPQLADLFLEEVPKEAKKLLESVMEERKKAR